MVKFPPTDKQLNYADNIAKVLDIPLPRKYDMVEYARYIAANLDEYHHKRLSIRQPEIDPIQPTIDDLEQPKTEHQPETIQEPVSEEKPRKTATRTRKKVKEPVYADSLPFPTIGNLPEGMQDLDSDLIRIAERYGAAIIIVNKAS